MEWIEGLKASMVTCFTFFQTQQMELVKRSYGAETQV